MLKTNKLRFFKILEKASKPLKTPNKLITMDELIDKSPSIDSPITLECFDGYFKNSYKHIKVVGLSDDVIYFINNHGNLTHEKQDYFKKMIPHLRIRD